MQKHPAAKPYRTTPFQPDYDKCFELYEGRKATGLFASAGEAIRGPSASDSTTPASTDAEGDGAIGKESDDHKGYTGYKAHTTAGRKRSAGPQESMSARKRRTAGKELGEGLNSE